MSAVTAASAMGNFSRRAISFSALRKQAAYPAANSCSGLVAPPGPPISTGVARSTSTMPSDERLCPLRPSPVAVAEAVYSAVAVVISHSLWCRGKQDKQRASGDRARAQGLTTELSPGLFPHRRHSSPLNRRYVTAVRSRYRPRPAVGVGSYAGGVLVERPHPGMPTADGG